LARLQIDLPLWPRRVAETRDYVRLLGRGVHEAEVAAGIRKKLLLVELPELFFQGA
jgi:hypothetical protein